MDTYKRNGLLSRLATRECRAIVTMSDFLDGNDDQDSIGPSGDHHPGMGSFRQTLLRLADLLGVAEVYVQVTETSATDGHWPAADLLFVVGHVAPAEVARVLEPLHPDGVAEADLVGAPGTLARQHGCPVLTVWWD